MGADHTAGFVGVGSSTTSLISASQSSQIHMAAIDSIGLCMFAQSGGLDNLFQAISAVTGKDFGNREWQEFGVRCLTAEVQFNRRTGLTKEDDRLPAMFYKEKLLLYHGTVSYADEELDDT